MGIAEDLDKILRIIKMKMGHYKSLIADDNFQILIMLGSAMLSLIYFCSSGGYVCASSIISSAPHFDSAFANIF